MEIDRPYRESIEATTVTNALFSAYAQIVRSNPPGAFGDYTRGYLEAFQNLGRVQLRMPATTVPPKDPLYTGPLFVLIDGGCVSACEDFAMPLRTSGRATLLGQRTAGSTGQPYYYAFSDTMSIRVSTKREYFPDGSRFEGVGIEPQVEIEPPPEELRAGRDPVLEKAEALAEEKAKGR